MDEFTLSYLIRPEFDKALDADGKRVIIRKNFDLFCEVPELLTGHTVTLSCNGKDVDTKILTNQSHFTLEADFFNDQLITIKIGNRYIANAILHGHQWVVDNTDLHWSHLDQVDKRQLTPLTFRRIETHLVPRALPATLTLNSQVSSRPDYYLVAPNLHCRLPIKATKKSAKLIHLPHSIVFSVESRSYLDADVVQRKPNKNHAATDLFLLSGKPHFRLYWQHDDLIFQRLTENNLTVPLFNGEKLAVIESSAMTYALSLQSRGAGTVERLVFGEAGKSLTLYLWRFEDYLWVCLDEGHFRPRFYLLLAPHCFNNGNLIAPVTIKIPESADSFNVTTINETAVYYHYGDKQLISSFPLVAVATVTKEPVE